MEIEDDYLIQLAKKHLANAKSQDNQNAKIDFRISTFAIVNFYNILMLESGKELNINIEESYNFERKEFIISREFPEILTKYDDLFKSIKKLRNKLFHTDITIPKETDLIKAVEKAEEFSNSLKYLISDKKSAHKKKLTLKEEYAKKIMFLNLWLDVPYPYEDFSKNFQKQSSRINKINDTVGFFNKVNVEQLDDKSIESLINILNITLEDAELIYEDIYSYCPECEGEIIEITEEETHYRGPYDDPEPDSYSVWSVVKCKDCGKIFKREHITTESL